MADISKGSTYADGGAVTAANLNALVDSATILAAFISAKSLKDPCAVGDEIVINDAGTLKKTTLNAVTALVLGGAGGIVHGKTAVTTLTDLDELVIWEDTVAAERKITRGSIRDNCLFVPVGGIVQTLYDENVSTATISTDIPVDNTVPLITEGDEIFSRAITLKNANCQVLIDVAGFATNTGSSQRHIAFSVFRGATCIYAYHTTTFDGQPNSVGFFVRDTPGSVGPHTYTVRAGPGGSGSLRLNGDDSGGEFGGVAKFTMTTREIYQNA